MAKRKTRKTSALARAALCGALAMVLASAAVALDLLFFYPDRPSRSPGEIVTVDIPNNVGPNGLAEVLREAEVLGSPRKFSLWLRLTGGLSRVRSGEVDLRPGMTPRELLDSMAEAGQQLGQRVTIPEGFTVRRIAQAVEKAGVARAKDIVALATDREFIGTLGIDSTTLEGFLFPDTYYFHKDEGARAVLSTLARTLPRKLEKAGLDPRRVDLQTLILASIVQAEAKLADEMPTIAGVYRNRLESLEFPSRLLQADPTVAYGCEPLVGQAPPSCRLFTGVLTRSQLDDPANAHNTYTHPGLPPTPICSPGLLAIRAALQPANVPYLFFVAQGNTGRHLFSTTLAEHNDAVRRYRESL
ncbi:MAG: endolytic transglycosylase MltG [Myxococcota bacterium]|jgi:UPF0755 protein|nr:endolytic transglycosylase MltG [Myxococcota bacterium]